jgi:bifunctional N-acetylglucosamine-1-phosphate-uridyltransferase/glucosamine-1-phosphate-acetyltransferase GlmU-like protein
MPGIEAAAAIVLAAGKGTRMRSALPKPLVPLAGRGLTLRLLDALEQAGVGRRVVVVGHGAEEVRAALPDGVATPLQAVRDGTASAVACGRDAAGDARHVFVLVGDSPLLTAGSLRALFDHHVATGAACSFLTATFPVAYPYARVLRGPGGEVLGCVEERDCTPAQAAVRELLTSHYLFDADALWAALPEVPRLPTPGERSLTDVIGIIRARGGRVEARSIPDWRELVGLNTPEEVAWAEAVLAGP